MHKKITLANGVRLVYEHIPYVRTVSFGLWIGVGSRYESERENGAAHMIEHLLFKGTPSHTAAQIAEKMDHLGGHMNAFTTKECTCLYGRVLDTNLRQAAQLLSDILLHSKFDEQDIIAERSVIGEEIDMYADSPDDLASDQLIEAVFQGSSLGRPILGTKESLSTLDRTELLSFHEKHYTPGRLVVTISGNFHESDLDYIQTLFAKMSPGESENLTDAVYAPSFILTKKTIEQNHLCLLFPGLPLSHSRRYEGQLLSSILGGGMSSRLFQTVREQHGLCYSIYSFGTSYQDQGLFGIYTALGRETEEKALQLIMDVLQDLHDNGVTESELERARTQATSNVLMGLESTSTRMTSLGRGELLRGKILTPEETIANYNAVTSDDVLAMARQLINFEKLSFSAVGHAASEEQYRTWTKR